MVYRQRGRKPLTEETLAKGRAALVAAARKLFAEQGVETVSVRRLATETGMSPMSFYRYFPNKRAVLIHIWSDIFMDVFARCDAATGSLPAREALVIYSQTFVAYWMDHRDHYLMVYCQPDKPDQNEDFFAQSAPIEGALAGLSGMVAKIGAEPDTVQMIVEHITCALHGICHSLITIPEMNWPAPNHLTRSMVEALLAPSQT